MNLNLIGSFFLYFWFFLKIFYRFIQKHSTIVDKYNIYDFDNSHIQILMIFSFPIDKNCQWGTNTLQNSQ